MTNRCIVFIALVLCASAAIAQTTFELLDDAQAALSQADAGLNTAYKEAMSTLPEENREGLKLAQRAWIAYRDACAKSEGALYAGGTLESVAAIRASADLTAEQASLLRNLRQSGLDAGEGEAVVADKEFDKVYAALTLIGGPDEAVKSAQRAWIKYRDSFAEAVAAIHGATAKDAALAKLTVLRTERLKQLFPEGYPPQGHSGPHGPTVAEPKSFSEAMTSAGDLCAAISRRDTTRVAELIPSSVAWQQACPEQLDYPLHVAIGTGDTAIVELLLDAGAPVDQPDAFMGGTPLHTAAGQGDVKMIELLLSRGADINGTDEEGFSVVDAARAAGREDMVRLLQAKDGKFARMANEPPRVRSEEPMREQTAQVPAQTAASEESAPEGRPVVKGFYVGMPFRRAVERMHELKLLESSHINADGSINWNRVIMKDDRGHEFAEGTQGLILLWKLVPDAQGRLAFMYWQGGVSAHLFNAKDMDSFEFAQTFVHAYEIDQMEPFEAPTDFAAQALGAPATQVGWQKIERAHGWRLAVHQDKGLVYQAVTKQDATAFD